jgi:hypothetical protein
MGIPAGPSTGMALARTYHLIQDGRMGHIVVISPDNNFKYGDLISENLINHKDDIIKRYPELELEKTISRYVDFLKNTRDEKWMLERVGECYPVETEGKLFKVGDIENIVIT